ncbi:MAG TPA: EAL domain-containing protein [Thermoanaerobaculia bacterium]|nr:EAL domain-containing protein [Thermoanaerobaculia bacterium]
MSPKSADGSPFASAPLPDERESLFRVLFEEALDSILILDDEARVRDANPAAETLLGRPRHDLLGMDGFQLVAADDRDDAHQRFAELLDTGSTTGEIPIERPTGEKRRIHYVARAGVTPGRHLVVFEDVTARRAAERRLKGENEVLARIARREPLDAILTGIARFFTEETGGLRCFIEARDEFPEATGGVFESGGAVVLPIRGAGGLLGAASVVTPGGRALTDEERELMALVAELAALALQRYQEENALLQSEARYRLLFQRNLAGVYRSSLDGKILDCNDSFARMLGFSSRDEALGCTAGGLYDSEAERETLVERIRTNGFVTNFESKLRKKDGSVVWVLENESYFEEEGASPVLEGTLVDITDRKKAEEELQRLAFHDPLTGLPNQLLIRDRIEVALSQARHSRQPVAVLFVDLDRFKNVNDSLGHSFGDALLREAAERLQAAVFEGDTVARLGGDEFLVLLARVGSVADVLRVSRKIFTAFKRPFTIDGRDLFVTLSMGMSLFPEDGADAETLIKNADTAMYRAKQQGRDNAQLYAPQMNDKALDRMTLETGLRKALDRGELAVYYQPVLDLNTGHIESVEALLRWRHRERGLLSPTEFIALAEETGLIVPIGAWVFRTACTQLRAWRMQGVPIARVAINLAARQVQEAQFSEWVGDILVETGLPPDTVSFEVTESAAMRDEEAALRTLHGLRELGVGLTLDDFGTGFSSLSLLRRYPIDTLKIDQSFVAEMLTNANDCALTVAAIFIAHGMNLGVIAEGVESAAQIDFLRNYRCDGIQGYHVSRPLPSADIAPFLAGYGRPA